MKKYFVLFFGGVIVVTGVCLIFQHIVFVQKATETTNGIVVEISKSGSKGSVSFAPVFEYLTKDSLLFRYKLDFSTFPSMYEVGETVKLQYDPNYPKVARPVGAVGYILIPVIFICLGVITSLLFFKFKTRENSFED